MTNHQDTVRLKASELEVQAYQALAAQLKAAPMPSNQILAHLPLYLTRSSLSHVLFMSDLYRQVLPVHGDVLEFGTRWGRNLALFLSLRNTLEPHNYARRVIGFDTFEGFASLSREDGHDPIVKPGHLAVSAAWEDTLAQLLAQHEALGPRPGVRRFELVKGDVCDTFPKWLERHPESLVALAYFDMDIYRPTKEALTALLPRLTRGSIVGFDELCLEAFPGETVALREVLDLSRHRLVRSPYSGNQSYIVWE
ncbi:MAG: class I SAM-dependent methyltransferase [Pseudomonadota bacterium]